MAVRKVFGPVRRFVAQSIKLVSGTEKSAVGEKSDKNCILCYSVTRLFSERVQTACMIIKSSLTERGAGRSERAASTALAAVSSSVGAPVSDRLWVFDSVGDMNRVGFPVVESRLQAGAPPLSACVRPSPLAVGFCILKFVRTSHPHPRLTPHPTRCLPPAPAARSPLPSFLAAAGQFSSVY